MDIDLHNVMLQLGVMLSVIHLKDLSLFSDISKILPSPPKIRPFNINKQLGFYKLFFIKTPPDNGFETPVVSGKVIGNLFTALPDKNAINSDSTKSIFIFIISD